MLSDIYPESDHETNFSSTVLKVDACSWRLSGHLQSRCFSYFKIARQDYWLFLEKV